MDDLTLLRLFYSIKLGSLWGNPKLIDFAKTYPYDIIFKLNIFKDRRHK
jgi:hypothetical protein